MSKLHWRLRWAGGLLLASFMAGGCATFKAPTIGEKDLAPEKKNRQEEAVRLFEEKRDYAQMQAALERWQQGDMDACRANLETLLIRRPDHRDARLLLADLLVCQQDSDAALEQVRQVLKDHPDDAAAEHALAMLLDAAGNTDEALTHYQRAATLEPANETYMADYRTAAGLGESEQQTAKQAKKASQQAASKPVVIHMGNEKDDTRITLANNKGVGVDHRVSDLLEEGRQSLVHQNISQAIECFRQAEALDPRNPQIPLKAAIVALRHEQPDLAAEILAQASVQYPTSAPLWRTLGAARYRMGDLGAAQAALEKAVSLDNSNALAYFLLGCTLEKQGRVEAAEQHYSQARSIDPRYGSEQASAAIGVAAR